MPSKMGLVGGTGTATPVPVPSRSLVKPLLPPPPSIRGYTGRMYPECAICHGPDFSCECERNTLDAVMKQAESKMMTSVYNDIRSVSEPLPPSHHSKNQ